MPTNRVAKPLTLRPPAVTPTLKALFRKVERLSAAHSSCSKLDCRPCADYREAWLALQRGLALAPWETSPADVHAARPPPDEDAARWERAWALRKLLAP